VSKIRPGFAVFFLSLVFLFPAPVWPQSGEEALEEFREMLKDRGLAFEEGYLFPGPGEGDEPERGETGLSLLMFFPGSAAGDGPPDPADPGGEWYAGAFPLMIAAFPLRAGGPGEEGPELPWPYQAALALAEQLRTREAAGRGLPGDLIIALLGEQDARRSGKIDGPAPGELSAYGGKIGDPENTFFWYFDLHDAPQSLRIHHGTSQTIAPLDSIRDLPELFLSQGIPHEFAVPFNELYKLQFAGGPEILRHVQEQEIRGLVFSRGRPLGPGSPGGISENALAELILSYAASLKNPGGSPDYHYVIFPLPGAYLFLSQERTAFLLVLIAAVFFLGFLCYAGFRPPPLARVLAFIRCFWVIPGYFLLFFVSLEGAGLPASLLAAEGESRIPMIYGWAVWKLILGLGFFSLISIPLGNYRIPRRADFYGSGALLLIILDIFIAAWADICFIPFFLAALLVIFLGTRLKHPVPVYLCAVSAPFYGITAGIFSALSGYGGLGEFLLSNRPFPTALMILAFLPFVLLFKRGIALSRREKPKTRHRLIPFFVLFSIALILGLVLIK
jgi:hypothetical protein